MAIFSYETSCCSKSRLISWKLQWTTMSTMNSRGLTDNCTFATSFILLYVLTILNATHLVYTLPNSSAFYWMSPFTKLWGKSPWKVRIPWRVNSLPLVNKFPFMLVVCNLSKIIHSKYLSLLYYKMYYIFFKL